MQFPQNVQPYKRVSNDVWRIIFKEIDIIDIIGIRKVNRFFSKLVVCNNTNKRFWKFLLTRDFKFNLKSYKTKIQYERSPFSFYKSKYIKQKQQRDTQLKRRNLFQLRQEIVDDVDPDKLNGISYYRPLIHQYGGELYKITREWDGYGGMEYIIDKYIPPKLRETKNKEIKVERPDYTRKTKKDRRKLCKDYQEKMKRRKKNRKQK